jgi:hypothetical protein
MRLREPTIDLDWTGSVSSTSDLTDYQKIVAMLVNDSKRNVEAYHDWLVLRQTLSLTTVSGTKNYNLNSGDSIKILEIINQVTGMKLSQASRQYMNSLMYPTEASGDPRYYCFNGADSSNNLKLDITPIPNKAETLSLDVSIVQDPLSLATDVIKVPTQPVILGAWGRAASERGEDGGSESKLIIAEAIDSLKQSIMIDSGNTQYESDWYV